jgi:hypothetical protein
LRHLGRLDSSDEFDAINAAARGQRISGAILAAVAATISVASA